MPCSASPLHAAFGSTDKTVNIAVGLIMVLSAPFDLAAILFLPDALRLGPEQYMGTFLSIIIGLGVGACGINILVLSFRNTDR